MFICFDFIDHILIKTSGECWLYSIFCLGIFTITPISPRGFFLVFPCVTSDISDTADWTLKALGGMMHFIITCWDLQKPVVIIGEGFETILFHVHALFQQLSSYNNMHRATQQREMYFSCSSC